jgi:hypothetical protein
MERFRRFSFTWNNPFMDKEKLIDYLTSNYIIRYIIVADEVSSNNTPHLQGYIEFQHQATWQQVKDRFPPSYRPVDGWTPWGGFLTNDLDEYLVEPYNVVHVEPSISSSISNINYCKKENNFIEFGTSIVPQTQDDKALQCITLITDENVPPVKIATLYPELASFVLKNYTHLHHIYNDVNDYERKYKK